MEKKDARSLKQDAQEMLRKRVVSAVEDGMSRKEATEKFGVSRTAIWQWMRRYEEGGDKALNKKKKGRPKKISLEPWQAAQTVRSIKDRCPDQLKMPFHLWTREAVGRLIEDRYGIKLSVWTVGRYLRRWGFTPQKPLRRAYEKDPEAVQRWLDEEYPEIRKAAKKEGAQIHWGDEMGLRSDHQAGTSYGKKGETPVIPGTGQRFGCNLISTVTNRGTLRFMVFTEEFNSEVFIKFLGRLLKSTEGKVFLIVDRHPSHRSRRTKKWIEERSDKIRMFFLPGYSPELNPDEYLNNDVKSNSVGRRRPASKEELVSDVRGYLRSTQKQPEIVMSYFHPEDVQYASI